MAIEQTSVWRGFLRKMKFLSCIPLYYIFRLFPLQNKVVATTFRGKKYGDNSQYILECIHSKNPNIKLVWLKNPNYNYSLPPYIRSVSFYDQWKKTYELATAKVWINTHRMEYNVRKREKQLFINTWHGGLGIKKIEGDVPNVLKKTKNVKEIQNTSKIVDLFISNSDHLTRIYRSAFKFSKTVWKCGYPKNDKLLSDKSQYREKIRNFFSLDKTTRLFLYAPTFRDSLENDGCFDKKPYDIDFSLLKKELESSWGGKWEILVRWHPVMLNRVGPVQKIYGNSVIDASNYPDTQDLIMGSDVLLSDYSSCIFDAALVSIPCFIYATDFDDYKKDRGVYYELHELPFSYATNNEQLIANIHNFDPITFNEKWQHFAKKTGLHETGHATQDIAYIINEYVQGNVKPLESIKSEP